MDIRVTARRVRMTPAANRHLAERLERLRRYVPELDHADVKISVEKHRHRAEVLLRVRQRDRVAVEEAADLLAALDGAVDRLEHQLRRLKEKGSRSAARTREDGPLRRSAARLALAPASAAGKRTAVRSRAAGAISEAGVAAGRGRETVLRQRLPSGKPLTLEEAVERLQETEEEFLVYLDSRSERPCILYRRKDGRLAVVEAKP